MKLGVLYMDMYHTNSVRDKYSGLPGIVYCRVSSNCQQ
jgi:hypothetical protein